MSTPPFNSNLSGEVKAPVIKSDADLVDFFSQDDDKTPVKSDIKPEDKEDKEEIPEKKTAVKDNEDEEDEDDIDLKDEDEDEDKLDLDEDEKLKKSAKDDDIEIDAPPRKKEVEGKFPGFFKAFPFMEKMMYRDRQYTELFGSFDDAKETAERAQEMQGFEVDLLNGNTEKILSEIKRIDKKAYDKLVDNYLPTLARVDKEAYLEVSGSIIKRAIHEMVMESRTDKSKAVLSEAASILNQFMFGSSTYQPYKPRVEETDTKQDEQLQQDRLNFTRERFEIVRTDLQEKVERTLRATISDYIDPKSEMSPYVKRNAIKDALAELHSTIGNDSTFRKSLDRLWEDVFLTKFSQQSQDRVRKSYLGKAKTQLRSVIKKARAEALKDGSDSPPARRARSEKEDEEETPRKRGNDAPGRPRQMKSGNKMEKGESVLDFFSRD